MGAIFSFLGGNAFRLIFGEIVSYLNRRQEHELELQRMKVQGDLEAAQHARNLEAIKVQADLGVKTIQVQRDADLDRIDASAWATAVADVGKQTGIKFLDIWNGSIRPGLATMAIIMVVIEIMALSFALTDWHRELFGAILGIYVADRSLARRGK